MPFFNYIISVPFPKGLKLPTDLEPHERSIDLQEHMDVLKSRMMLVKASNPIKYKAFSITLKKATLK